jgi:hypothetical protein
MIKLLVEMKNNNGKVSPERNKIPTVQVCAQPTPLFFDILNFSARFGLLSIQFFFGVDLTLRVALLLLLFNQIFIKHSNQQPTRQEGINTHKKKLPVVTRTKSKSDHILRRVQPSRENSGSVTYTAVFNTFVYIFQQ